ncbi:Proteasome activator BLM10 [Malassezia sp. CBS 17886]|nr:Proteasome activator BLM10 [Malassezia sp. CBS 17886]
MEFDLLELEPMDDVDAEESEGSEELEEDMSAAPGTTPPAAVRPAGVRKAALAYAHSLPYATESVAEFEEKLSWAIARLLACISAEDFDVGFLHWNQYVRSLLGLRYPIVRATRAELARVYYEVAVMPSLDARVVQAAASTSIWLLRPKKELGLRDLQLAWRPLYEVLFHDIYHKQRKVSVTNAGSALLDMAEFAQRFFPADEAPAMLATVFPLMDGSDLNSVIAAQALLVHLLPLAQPQQWLPALFRLWDTFNSSLFDDQMLDHLARLSELLVADPCGGGGGAAADTDALGVWRETGIFTDAQFATVMTKCLRSAGLPVGTNKTANAALMEQSSGVRTGADAVATHKTLRIKRPSDRLRSFAVILVYSMAEDGGGGDAAARADADAEATAANSKALAALAQFVEATETYFHPSNWGPWQMQLATLVQHLTWEFAKRCKEEERADCRTPRAWRLTPAIKRAFVTTLRPVCLLSMFAKDPLTVFASQTSLKRMAYLHPELIVPAVLQRSFASLEALETTQRTTAVISSLAALAPPLVSRRVYAAGAKHVVPLLHLCLPGIDLNDPMKTVNTCVFVLAATLCVKLDDLTEDASADAEDGGAGRDAAVPVDEEHMSTRGAEDYALRLATGELDAWATGFVRRILHLFDMLPDEGKSGKIGEKNEELVLTTLTATCDVFCSALSDSLFDRTFAEVVEYVRTTVSASGVKAVGSLVACFARADSAKVLHALVPLCCARIAQELAHGASSVRTTSTSAPHPQDTALHWHMSVLHGALLFAGEHLLAYRTQLVDTLALLARACLAERGYLLTAKLLQRVFTALGGIYPAEQRFVNADVWASAEFQRAAHEHWGTMYAFPHVRVQWHVPCSEELDMLVQIVDRVATPALAALDDLLRGDVRHDGVWQNDFCRHLQLVRFAYAGLVNVGGDGDEGGAEGAETKADTAGGEATKDGGANAPPEHPLTAAPIPTDLGAEPALCRPPPVDVRCGTVLAGVRDPRAAAVVAFRAHVDDVLVRAAQRLEGTAAADHIDAARLLVRALRTRLLQNTVNADELHGLAKSVAFFRTLGRTWAKQSEYPRILWVRRAALYHLSRMRLRGTFARRTRAVDALVDELVRLCLSHYVTVRRMAQTALDGVCARYDGTRAHCLPALLAALARTDDEHAVKGALHVLSARAFVRTAVRNVQFTHPVAVALLRAQAHARPSIQKRVRSVLNELASHLLEPAVLRAYTVSPTLTAAVAAQRRALPQAGVAEFERAAHAAVVARRAQADAAHAALVDAVLATTCAPATHWAFRLFGVRLLRQLLRRDDAPNARVAALFAAEVVSENPAMRHHAQLALTRLLYWIKVRSLGDGAAVLLERVTHPLRRVGAPPAGALVDKRHGRWLVAHGGTYYEPPPSAAAPVEWEPASRGALDAVRTQVCTRAWWTRLGEHLAQERERDYLSADTTTMLKSVFQMFGTDALAPAQHAVDALLAQRDRHKHRAAAEITAGAFRGAKHWPQDAQAALAAWVDTWLPRVLRTCTLDSQPAWQMCVEYVFRDRDPRRAMPLLRTVLAFARESLAGGPGGTTAGEGAAGEGGAGQEAALQGAASASPWQQAHAQQTLSSALRALKEKALPHGADALPALLRAQLAHDYQEVRQAVCESLVELEFAQLAPAFPTTDAFLAASAASHASLLGTLPDMASHTASLADAMRAARAGRRPSAQGVSTYDRLATSVCFWLSMSLEDHRQGPAADAAVRLLPDLFAMYQLRDNAELSALARGVLVRVVSYPLRSDQVHPLLHALLALVHTSSDSWHARLDALPFLQIVYFQNLFYLRADDRDAVLQLVLHLLHDRHLEVREMAATTLSGIVRCSQRPLLRALRERFAAAVRAVRLPARGAAEYEARLLELHAAVLGAAALVAAFPYEVPDWMPALVLDTVAVYSDAPVPVSTTVRRCAADFRRTHQDTWAQDQHQFGERIQEVNDFTLGRSDYFV